MIPVPIGQLPNAPYSPFEARELSAQAAAVQHAAAEVLQEEGNAFIADLFEELAQVNDAVVASYDQMVQN